MTSLCKLAKLCATHAPVGDTATPARQDDHDNVNMASNVWLCRCSFRLAVEA